MLYVHILEILRDGATKYMPVYCDTCEFNSPTEKEFFTPNIRATFKEHSGNIGSMNAQIAQWAKDNNLSVEGISSTSQYFELDAETYVTQLEARIERMTVLLQVQKDKINAMNDAVEQTPEETDEEHCHVHERLEKLETLIQCAKQNGCKHIDAAIAEIHSGGSHGH